MVWFLEKRLAVADVVALATVGAVYLQAGLLPACGAAAGCGVLLSVGRFLAGMRD